MLLIAVNAIVVTRSLPLRQVPKSPHGLGRGNQPAETCSAGLPGPGSGAPISRRPWPQGRLCPRAGRLRCQDRLPLPPGQPPGPPVHPTRPPRGVAANRPECDGRHTPVRMSGATKMSLQQAAPPRCRLGPSRHRPSTRPLPTVHGSTAPSPSHPHLKPPPPLDIPAQRRETENNGRVAEWFKAPVLKTGERESVPWVRIPPLPPFRLRCHPAPSRTWLIVQGLRRMFVSRCPMRSQQVHITCGHSVGTGPEKCGHGAEGWIAQQRHDREGDGHGLASEDGRWAQSASISGARNIQASS